MCDNSLRNYFNSTLNGTYAMALCVLAYTTCSRKPLGNEVDGPAAFSRVGSRRIVTKKMEKYHSFHVYLLGNKVFWSIIMKITRNLLRDVFGITRSKKKKKKMAETAESSRCDFVLLSTFSVLTFTTLLWCRHCKYGATVASVEVALPLIVRLWTDSEIWIDALIC